MEYRTTYLSPLGELTLASDGAALSGLWLAGQKHFGGKCTEWKANDRLPVFMRPKEWLDAYFAGEKPVPAKVTLAPQGTAFQQTVWRRLLTIPYGETISYGQLAADIGCASARAVGSAVGRNPVSIMIPCHRVVGADGRLTGYAGGMDRKKWLLAHEKRSKRREELSRQQ